MRDPADRLVSDTDSIIKEMKHFYKTLYAAEDTDRTAQEETFAHIDKTLTQEQNEVLAAKISKQEILQAITSMANGKSPGSDGLLPESYKTFSHLLVADLLKVYGDLFSNERMSSSQRLAQEIFQDSQLGKNWKYFPTLGKRWDKIFLSWEKSGFFCY